MLFAEKYQIRDFSNLLFNRDAGKQLKSIASSERDRIPHLILQGPCGSGRETLLNLYLQELFDKSIWSTKIDIETINKKEYALIYSKYHWVLDFSMCGNDRAIITSRINQVIEYPVADAPYRVIVIRHAENLTRRAQEALKRIMETKVADARLIMLTDSLYSFEAAFTSRCTVVRCGAPSNNQLKEIVSNIARAEDTILHTDTIDMLIDLGERHLTNTITALQHLCIDNASTLSGGRLSDADIIGSFHSKKYLHDNVLTTLRSKNILRTHLVMLQALDVLCIHRGNYHDVLWETYQNLQHWLLEFSKTRKFDCSKLLTELVEIAMDCDHEIRYQSNMKKIQLDRFTVHTVSWINKVFKQGKFDRNKTTKYTAVLKKRK